MINTFCSMMFMMAAGHAYADFALQPSHQSAAKRPDNNTGIPWYVAITAHSLIHGGIVALITGIWWLGLAETIMHAIIDNGKARGHFSTAADQVLHAVCKVIWVMLAVTWGT